MPHRDDHDAALLRADALQAELDREREAHADQGERIAELERELGAARTRLERAEVALGDIKPRKPVDADRPRPGPHVPQASFAIPAGIFGLVALALLLGWCITRSGDDDASSAASAPTGDPAEPETLDADTVVQRALRRVTGADVVVTEISIDYVAADGTLDQTHGSVVIDTGKRPPPKPPDDPSRPTGAPSTADSDRAVAMWMMRCPRTSWQPREGWHVEERGCTSFGDLPSGRPRCTVPAIIARAKQDGAPAGLARIQAVGRRAWTWTYSISDGARDIHFSHDYDDNCPVEQSGG